MNLILMLWLNFTNMFTFPLGNKNFRKVTGGQGAPEDGEESRNINQTNARKLKREETVAKQRKYFRSRNISLVQSPDFMASVVYLTFGFGIIC